MRVRRRSAVVTALGEPQREHLEHHHGDQHRRPDDREHEHHEACCRVAHHALLAAQVGAPRRLRPKALTTRAVLGGLLAEGRLELGQRLPHPHGALRRYHLTPAQPALTALSASWYTRTKRR